MTAFAAARLFDRATAWSAALVLGSSAYYVIMGHFNTLDMGVTFFMCASLFAFLLAMEAESVGARRGWMYAAWAAAAFATLSKGLEAVVLPGAVFVLYTLITREWARWKQLHFIGGLSIYLMIAAPWFLLVSLRNPEFPQFFFIHEHFQRFLTTVHHRTAPWWFFIPILLFAVLPFLPQFLRRFLDLFYHGSFISSGRRFNHALFLWLWCGFIFLFFSLSDSKLGSYILPILPALAVLVGWELTLQRRGDAMLSALFCIGLALATLWLAPLLREDGGSISLEMYQAFLPWLVGGSIGLLIAAAAAMLLAYFRRVAAAFALLGSGLLLGTLAITSGAQTLSPAYSKADLARQIAAYDRPGQPFYSLDDYPQSLPFYLKRTLTIVAYQGELEFGIGQEPQKWIPDLEGFIAQWGRDKAALAVMPPGTYSELQKQGLPMQLIGRDPDHVVVRKP
jgi:4-amino-4-deoxy-L-arabinose transferase-like glycosyltransferase